MGIINDYMNQTRKPEGILGKMMILGMNMGHAGMAKWGTSFLDVKLPEQIVDLGCGGCRIYRCRIHHDRRQSAMRSGSTQKAAVEHNQ